MILLVLLFQGLNRIDQENLLATNGALYLNYILGKYFTAEKGTEQLEWLLGSRFVNHVNRNLELARVDIVEFNACVNLFENEDRAKEYVDTAKNGLTSLQVGPAANGIIAALILYNTRPFENGVKRYGTMGLSDAKLVNAAFQTVKKWISKSPDYAHFDEKTPRFIDCLIHLKDIFQVTSPTVLV